jgi:exosome complex component RRP45
MLDCACLAGIVAFKHFRRPEVEVIGDEVTIVRPLSIPSSGLVVNMQPVSILPPNVHQFPCQYTTLPSA